MTLQTIGHWKQTHSEPNSRWERPDGLVIVSIGYKQWWCFTRSGSSHVLPIKTFAEAREFADRKYPYQGGAE